MKTMILAATMMVMLTACGTAANGSGGYANGTIRGRLAGEVPYGPPPGVAMLDSAIPGCSEHLLVQFRNETDASWIVYVDGEELSVNGETTYEAIPPRSHAFVCLDFPGRHSVSGEAYDTRYGEWAKVGEFDTHAIWDYPRGANRFHTFYLSRAKLRGR
jgi:hypothetical protein